MIPARRVILAKIESTYRTDAAPTVAADEVLVESPAFSWIDQRMYERSPTKPSLGMLKALYAGGLGQFEFEAEIKGSGTAGTAPEIDALLRGCGFGVTNVPATSDTYAPVSSGYESLTIWFYDDGKLYKGVGCRGMMTANLETGSAGKLKFTFVGHFTTLTDVALVTPTYNAQVPAPLLNLTSFSADSYAAEISALTFDMGIQLAKPPVLTTDDGYGEIFITGRKVTGGLDPIQYPLTTYDWRAKLILDTVASLDTGVVGGTGGNQYQISFPKAQWMAVGHGDRDGVTSHEIEFLASENSGDDEISIVFS